MKQKYYFQTSSSEMAFTLEYFEDEVPEEGDEITLFEAIPDNSNQDYIWCTHYHEIVDKDQCKKSFCPHYESKSGRGVCKNKGNLFEVGNPVKFKLIDNKLIQHP